MEKFKKIMLGFRKMLNQFFCPKDEIENHLAELKNMKSDIVTIVEKEINKLLKEKCRQSETWENFIAKEKLRDIKKDLIEKYNSKIDGRISFLTSTL